MSRTDASNRICHSHLPPTGTAGFSISPELFSASSPFTGAHSAATDRARLERLNIVSATSPEIVSEKQLSSPEKNTDLKTHADPTLWVIVLPFNIIQYQMFMESPFYNLFSFSTASSISLMRPAHSSVTQD